MKTIEHEGRYVILMEDAESMNGSQPERFLARGRAGLYQDTPKNATQVDVPTLIQNINALGDEIKCQLVAMDEEVDLVLTALIAGETVFFLSLPGAAKTTLARLIAQGIDGNFFRKNLTADTSRNDIFGPLDPEKIKQGQWGRKLAGLATATVANVDEVFRASGPVLDMLLEALEEHTLAEPDTIHELPLVLGISASNELVNATIHNAFWDRLIIRKEVSYPTRAEDWEVLLSSPHGTVPIKTRIDPTEIMLVQGLVELMAGDLPAEIVKRMTRIKLQLDKRGIPVSPRRFLAWARVATASSILLGQTPLGSKSLIVGQHILWISQEDIPEVRDIVGRLSDPERGVLLAAAADLEHILANLDNEDTTLEHLVQWQAKIQKHQKLIEAKVTALDLFNEKEKLTKQFQDAGASMIARSSELMTAVSMQSQGT
ncbi:MAG: MoxR family ATPase [Chloroflexi bacterium]|nr:MoxR family ATPase [Chloroflexota bacterium]